MSPPLGLDATAAGFVAALARAGGLAFTAPLLGDKTTPTRVRLVFTVAVAAVLAARRAAPADPVLALAALPIELGAGLVTGITARFILERVSTGAQLIGIHAGLGFAQSYDHAAGESATVVRALVSTIGGLAFLAADGLEALVRALATPVSTAALADGLTGATDAALQVAAAAIGIAAPVLLAATIVNVGLALINRAAPAVNVFSISLPVVLVIAGIALLSTASITAGAIDHAASDAVAVLLGGRS
ncbi:MAG TPA: flagellar biosynthetic protein FliR [Kofleriaceae bacterium]|nr:flagellar biosynthetic protein FliR [Kofleriaceae bacterium]